MVAFLLSALAFVAVFLAVFAVSAVATDMRSSERRVVRNRMEEQFRSRERQRVRSSLSAQTFDRIVAEAGKGPSDLPLGQRLSYLIEQSGIETTVARVTTYGVVLGIICGAAIGLLTFSILAALLVAMVGGVLPWLLIVTKRNKRIERLRGQLPDAFDLMSRVLRAGQTISQAMLAVSDEFSEPISTEFLYCTEQMNLGLTPEAALRELGRRTGILEIKIFVLAVVVHRQTGGNLAELLDKLGEVVRERFRIRGMIRSLTAQGRFQAGILLSLPPAMFLLLMVLQRDYETLLLNYPLMIVAALGLMALGASWIWKVVNFDY